MATVYVNDKPVDIGNERMNCVQAAQRARHSRTALLLASVADCGRQLPDVPR